MSKSDRSVTVPAGIRARHSRSCPSRSGDACQCSPAYEAGVYSKQDGKKVRRTFDNLAEAKRWVNAQRKSKDDGGLRAPARISLKDAAAEFLRLAESGGILNRSGDPFKPGAVRAYKSSLDLHVLPKLGSVRLSDVTRDQLQRLVASWQAEGQSASSIGNSVNALRTIYRNADLLCSGVIPVNPTRDLRLPARRGKRDRIASPDEASALLAALPAADRALWATAFYAGLRRGELRALRWENVDLAGGKIHVKNSWDDKDGEIQPKSRAGIRTVPIAGKLRDLLLEHRMDSGRGEGLVFGKDADIPFVSTTVRNRANSAWKAAGIPGIGLHEARHTTASWMIAAGIDLKALSSYMGHASVAFTLDRYGHLLAGSEAENAAKLDAFMARASTADRLSALD